MSVLSELQDLNCTDLTAYYLQALLPGTCGHEQPKGTIAEAQNPSNLSEP